MLCGRARCGVWKLAWRLSGRRCPCHSLEVSLTRPGRSTPTRSRFHSLDPVASQPSGAPGCPRVRAHPCLRLAGHMGATPPHSIGGEIGKIRGSDLTFRRSADRNMRPGMILRTCECRVLLDGSSFACACSLFTEQQARNLARSCFRSAYAPLRMPLIT